MIVVKEHASTVRNRTGKVRFARAMPTTNPRTGMLWERDCILCGASSGKGLLRLYFGKLCLRRRCRSLYFFSARFSDLHRSVFRLLYWLPIHRKGIRKRWPSITAFISHLDWLCQLLYNVGAVVKLSCRAVHIVVVE